jgi:hypothetical protein
MGLSSRNFAANSRPPSDGAEPATGTGLVLPLEVQEMTESEWTCDWLRKRLARHASTPAGQLLAVFDLLDAEFCKLESCSPGMLVAQDPVTPQGAWRVAPIQGVFCELARQTGLENAEEFEPAWHVLICGAIAAAREGDRSAAQTAKHAATLILAAWPRLGSAGN